MEVAATIVAVTSLLGLLLRFALMWRAITSASQQNMQVELSSKTPLSIKIKINPTVGDSESSGMFDEPQRNPSRVMRDKVVERRAG